MEKGDLSSLELTPTPDTIFCPSPQPILLLFHELLFLGLSSIWFMGYGIPQKGVLAWNEYFTMERLGQQTHDFEIQIKIFYF